MNVSKLGKFLLFWKMTEECRVEEKQDGRGSKHSNCEKQTCPGLYGLLSRGHSFRVRNAFWEEISTDEEVCPAHFCNKIPKL